MSRTIVQGKDARFSDVSLRESAFSSPGSLTVDEEAGVIRGVKIAGKESANGHGMSGAIHGTRYKESAFTKAIPLYEAALSNKNHNVPSKANPHDSDPNMRLGWFTNVRIVNGEVYGDYNVLKTDPLSAKLFEAARRNPRCFALSHNAYGRGKVVDGWFEIDEILSVDSIDLVADGGTNVSLFESRKKRPMKTTFRKLLLESKNPAVQAFAKKSHVVKLLEMDGLGDSVLDTPEPAPEDAPAVGWKEHLGEMLKAMVTDEAMDPADIKKKLNAALKLLEEGGKDEGDDTIDLEESDDDDAPPDKKKDDDKDKETKESLKRENAKLKDLATCRKLCESEGFPTATQSDVERVQKMDNADDRKWLISTLKNGRTPSKTPQSQAPGTRIKESAAGNSGTPAAFQPVLRG